VLKTCRIKLANLQTCNFGRGQAKLNADSVVSRRQSSNIFPVYCSGGEKIGRCLLSVVRALDVPNNAERAVHETLRTFGDSAFELVHVDHHFTIIDRASTVFKSTHSILLRAKASSRFYERVYYWSGTGKEGFPKLVTQHDLYGHPLQRILGDVIREGTKRTVVIDLGAAVEPGELAMIELEHFFVDVGSTFQPFLAHTVSHGMDSLRMKVTLPSEAKAISYETFTTTSQVASGSKPIPVSEKNDGSVTYSISLENPERSTRHRIGWEMNTNEI
jgi:hypothetical protein